ncbi:MAG: sigma-70 family RNA polymerase sigma factor [Bacteroidota bacterium]
MFRRRYPTHAALFAGLQAGEERAVLALQTRAEPMVRKLVRERGMDNQLTEDILNRGTLIFLRKIAAGEYEFRGHAPTTYLVEIAKRLLFAAQRKRDRRTEALEAHPDLADPDPLTDERRTEAAEMVGTLLDRLGNPCARVIRLHHLDGYRDEEVVRRKMTPYSTVNSLKMKRSGCMKKLIKLAQAWKTVNSI